MILQSSYEEITLNTFSTEIGDHYGMKRENQEETRGVLGLLMKHYQIKSTVIKSKKAFLADSFDGFFDKIAC